MGFHGATLIGNGYSFSAPRPHGRVTAPRLRLALHHDMRRDDPDRWS